MKFIDTHAHYNDENFKGIEELPILSTKIPGTLCVKPTDLYEGFFVAKIRKNK